MWLLKHQRPLATAKSKNTCHNSLIGNGASTPESTPKLRKYTCDCAVCAVKLRPSLKLFESISPRGMPCLCANEARSMLYVSVLICRVFFSCFDRVASPSPQATVWAPAWAPEMVIRGHQRRRPRRGFMPQVKSAHWRLKHALWPSLKLFEGTSPRRIP